MLHILIVVLTVFSILQKPQSASTLDSDNVTGGSCSNSNPYQQMTTCANRQACVPLAWVCNGKADCSDGSDETVSSCIQVHTKICPQTITNSSQFTCKDGSSIDQEKVCDGENDCTDGSDETECNRCYCKYSSSMAFRYFQCRYGACIEKEKRCDGNEDCPDGSDEVGCHTTTATITLPPKQSCEIPPHPVHGQNYVLCSKGGNEKICKGNPGQMVKHGTWLVSGCQFKYQLAGGDGYSVCQDGVWRPQQQPCIECGVSNKNFDTYEELLLIRNGEKCKLGDFPWMAGLYRKNNADTWKQICGATLITPHIVLTAAHCVTTSLGEAIPADEIVVGLGKLYRDFDRNETDTIYAKVREVVLPERYVGSSHIYDLDIALLDLTVKVPVSSTIRPACLDLGGRLALRQGNIGYLAGWGTTEDGRASEDLRWGRQEYIDYAVCKEKVEPKNTRFITHDKFCIAGVRGAQADHGDSGGGLTFTIDGIHFVMGIVSTAMPRGEGPVVLFTNLANGEHRSWLRDQRRRLTAYHLT